MGARTGPWYVVLGSGLLALCELNQVAAQPGEIAPAPGIKITNTNYVAANGNNPPTADPEGTWTKPVEEVDWRVEWTFGTGTGKDFKATDTGTGGARILNNKASGTWGKVGAETLKQPLPANLHVRVQLQRKENNVWVTKAVDFKSIP